MPPGLDIDVTSRLRDTVAFHRAHVVVNERRTDWASRFEDEARSLGARVKSGMRELGEVRFFMSIYSILFYGLCVGGSSANAEVSRG